MQRAYVLHDFQAPTRLQIDYSGELNEQQHAAVTAPPGPALVIAGAGSGKTRALTYRVAFLLEHGIAPEQIILLTFTNKAAREMMGRVADLLGQKMDALWGGTFHSIGNRVLRRHAGLLGFERDFSILDREDSRHLVTACLADLNIDTKSARHPKADLLTEVFSLAVNTERPVAEVLASHHGQYAELAPGIERVRMRYIERKRAANAMDYDDLLALWLKLLREHDEVRELYQRRFQYILVDEYQDTNRIQGDLIDLLAEGHGNVMVVGDDAQSIYAWRGADFHNILQFPKRYPGAKVYRIEVNYRSTPEILQVANAAISANQFQFQKELAPARKSGMKPVVVACRNASEQAAFVAQRALELRDEGIELDHMAVLYRSHFHALELQLELTRQNIPFSITSGIRFFEQAHIKDVAAHIKFVVNPRDELSFKRIVQLLPGVGGKGAAKLWERFEREAASARASGDSAFLGAAIQRCESAAGKKTRTAWAQFSATIAQLERALEKESAADLIALVLQAGYEDYLKESYANHGSRMDDLEQLAIFARQFNTIEDCLTQLALLTNLEAEGDRPADDDERLRLSTVHQAKGLEFEVVFVIMLCDGLFPSARSLDHDESVEEERRLMYVAITRAKTELYLCYPEARASYNDDGETPQRISRFLREIPRELMEDWNLTRPF